MGLYSSHNNSLERKSSLEGARGYVLVHSWGKISKKIPRLIITIYVILFSMIFPERPKKKLVNENHRQDLKFHLRVRIWRGFKCHTVQILSAKLRKRKYTTTA